MGVVFGFILLMVPLAFDGVFHQQTDKGNFSFLSFAGE